MSKEPKRNVYVGHRYVPKIMGEWDKQETYEGLSIVTDEGTSYTSKKRVPVGIDILNEEYWVVTGNYNAQIEEYRKDVRDMGDYVNNEVQDLTNYVNNEVQKKADKEEVNNKFSDVNQQLAETNDHLKEIRVDVVREGFAGNGTKEDIDLLNDIINTISNGGGGTVYFPEGIYYIDVSKDQLINSVGGIILKSDVNLELHPKTILKAIPISSPYYNIISIFDSENVVVSGGNIEGERNEHIGDDGEWGHGISILNSDNVRIENINISNCWGDGLYVGGASGVSSDEGTPTRPAEKIIINNVICDNNRRQGMSVTNAIDMFVSNCIFKNTGGTEPMSGVNVEPNSNQTTKNIFFENCVFNNNKRGFQVFANRPGSIAKDILLNNCLFNNNDYGITLIKENVSKITINGTHINDSGLQSITIRDGVDEVIIKDVIIDGCEREAIHLREVINVLISDAVLSNVSGVGVFVMQESKNIVFQNININGDETLTEGFHIIDSEHVSIKRCSIIGSYSDGVRFDNVQMSDIAESNFQVNNRRAISILSSDDNKLSNNSFFGDAAEGSTTPIIRLLMSDSNAIIGNMFRKKTVPTSWHVLSLEDSDNNYITNNDAFDVAIDVPFYIRGVDNVVEGNRGNVSMPE